MSKGEFMSVLSDYCVQEGFSVIVLKSDKRRYTAECSEKLCTWKLHSSCLPDSINSSCLPDSITRAIKTLTGNHKEYFNLKRNPMATVPWMDKKLETGLRAHPEMPVKSMADLLMKGYGIDVRLRRMYKVRIAVAEMVYGGFEESYNSLAAYGETGGQTGGPVHFKAIFVSFHSWILGFLRGCRPIIGVNGCHLKGRYKEMLLSAISVDANNNLYCIAYAIVGKENTESWSNFFRNLRLAFQSVGCSKWDWTFISDRMKGVERALEKEFPQCTKRICAQHLYSNFKLKWGRPAFHDLFWRVAIATSTHAFHKAIEEINKLSRPAVDYLLSVEDQWSKSQFDPVIACDHNTSNFVESFNALINDLREKPMMTLMEGIRIDFMAKMAERMEVADGLQMHEPTPYAMEILEYNIHGSNQCMVIKAGGGEFEVLEGTKPHPVDILKGTCLCGEWPITGIPCKHACRAIFDNRDQPVDYVHGFYRGQCYKLTYGEHMHPLPDKDAWPVGKYTISMVVLSIGHWYLHTAVYFDGDSVLGCHYIEFFDVFGKAFNTTLKEIVDRKNLQGNTIDVIVTTFSPHHFEGGWDKFGACPRTKPFTEGGKVLEGMDANMRK
ncbi:uncharacterized protein LOC141590001 [Silene latifolia]|uniref:uncharacterized protein LOC141590001 n=1 Tax=Silene latifolia TaxID=37657 RepID=UPI003D779471